MKRLVRLALCAGATLMPAAAAAQTANPAAAPTVLTSETAPRPSSAEPAYPRFGRAVEHSLGLRTWAWNTPAWMVGFFAHVEGDWSGPMSASPALEYVYRKGALDLVVGLQYTSLATDAGFLRGRNENDVALERVQSNLWTFSANVLFLWTTRFNDWFELQYGMGAGVSYVGGTLNRTQAYRDSGGALRECSGTFSPNAAYCDNANNHYRAADGTRYAEPRLGSGGNIPPAVPWLSIPHVALHFRPHRHVDIRVDGGFGVIGFYGGAAAHYVF